MNEYEILARSAVATALVNARGRFSRRYASPRRILVIKLDHLGDVILATPALRALRETHAGVPIDALVRPDSRALLEGSPLVDRVFSYDAPRFRRTAAAAAPTKERDEVVRNLAPIAYDWVVELRGDEWTLGGLLQVLRPARRFDRGTARVRDWVARRSDRLRGRRLRPPRHEVETNLEIIRGGVQRWPDRPIVEAPPWPHAQLELDRVAREVAPGFDFARPYVVLQLGASWGPRAWRPEAFGAVAASMRTAYDAQVAVLGVAEDSFLRKAFEEGGGPAGTAYFFGALTIPAVGALLRRAKLYIGSDGGVAHLAAACGTPSVVLFGPQDPARFGPWGDNIRILHHPVECFPCAQVICVRPENPCVNLNSVDETLNAAKTLWEIAPSRSERAPAGP